MFSDNLVTLRKAKNMTQEELAEKLNVTRQTLSKWETGDSLPDIEKSRMIADIFDVSLDELVTHENINGKLLVPPVGKHFFGTVKVGEKGQIVIPARARKVFAINPGDRLILSIETIRKPLNKKIVEGILQQYGFFDNPAAL